MDTDDANGPPPMDLPDDCLTRACGVPDRGVSTPKVLLWQTDINPVQALRKRRRQTPAGVYSYSGGA